MADDAPPERIGDYVIVRQIGEGGMAKVYEARHAILDSRHAIKVLDPSYRANPEARQRFLDEAKIQASQLDHPNIVKVVNIVATTEHAALVMELIEGTSLEEKVTSLRDNPAEIRRIMLAVLDAVGAAHDAGIIHRDLKPANVLLAMKGGIATPKVTDFGIAKVGGTVKKSTHHEARMGTLSYSSPEQLRRAKDVTPRSDVFSLGAMLYELATGAPAFSGDSDYDLMDDIVRGRFTPPAKVYPAIDPVIAKVIVKALSPDPEDRYASCKAMAEALGGATRVAAVDVATISSAPESRKRGVGLWIALGGVAAASAAIAVFAMKSGAPTSSPPDAATRVASPPASPPPPPPPAQPVSAGSGDAPALPAGAGSAQPAGAGSALPPPSQPTLGGNRVGYGVGTGRPRKPEPVRDWCNGRWRFSAPPRHGYIEIANNKVEINLTVDDPSWVPPADASELTKAIGRSCMERKTVKVPAGDSLSIPIDCTWAQTPETKLRGTTTITCSGGTLAWTYDLDNGPTTPTLRH